MVPRYRSVADAYPEKIPYDHGKLFELIGWEDLINKPNFENTCAIRVSLGLTGAGMSIPGRMKVNKGGLKGRLIEPGQARLSNILARKSMLGAPEKFRGQVAAERGIGTRSGIVSFWRIYPTRSGDNQGHIDLVSPGNRGYLGCRLSCYFDAMEVWFWPLK